jgi:hypothetical protein
MPTPISTVPTMPFKVVLIESKLVLRVVTEWALEVILSTGELLIRPKDFLE